MCGTESMKSRERISVILLIIYLSLTGKSHRHIANALEDNDYHNYSSAFSADAFTSVRDKAEKQTTTNVSSDNSKVYSFQPVLHDWCNKGRGMCYPVCGMVHIKEPLLLIDKSSLCGDSGFPFSLSEWSLTICLTPFNRR